MTQLHIDDFKLGLDIRRSILTANPGSCQTLDNAIITQGGEIEKAQAFVQVATLPAGTFAIYGTDAGFGGTEQLYTFKTGVPAAPVQIDHVPLVGGTDTPIFTTNLTDTGSALTQVFSVTEYGPATFFVVGEVATPTLVNWWNGVVVPNFTGFAPLVSAQKMYRVRISNLYFSGVGDPSATDPLNPGHTGPNTVNPGAGFIDCSRLDSDAGYLIGMEAYYKQVAIFSRRVCLLFSLDPDLANNTFTQLIRIGALSNNSILQFGTGEVLFLSDAGIRSLRALNAAMTAAVNDIGAPIDRLIQSAIKADSAHGFNAQALVDPITGRYWLAIGNVIYVLNVWPSAKISAWSTITLPFNVDFMTTAGARIYVRSGNNLYLYGGLDGATYDTRPATVRTPHHSADSPTTYKKPMSIGAAVEGNWAVSVGTDTENTDFYELAANLTGNTYSMQKIPFSGSSTHFGFKLVTTDAGPARLGALHIRFHETVET